MKKALYLFISFSICLVLRAGDAWIWFCAAFMILNPYEDGLSAMWQTVLGSLATVTLVLFCKEYEPLLFRSLFVLSAAIISATKPNRLFLLFAVSTAMLIIGDDTWGTYAMSAALWCSVRFAFGNTRVAYK